MWRALMLASLLGIARAIRRRVPSPVSGVETKLRGEALHSHCGRIRRWTRRSTR